MSNNQVIPDAAVFAAAKVLYADKMSNHSGDNAPKIIAACESVARKILEAAAPHIWEAAYRDGHLDAASGVFRPWAHGGKP